VRWHRELEVLRQYQRRKSKKKIESR